MTQTAPNFYSEQIVSAEIHMNELGRSVNSAYGSLHGFTPAVYAPVGYYGYEDSKYIYSDTFIHHYDAAWYLWVTVEYKGTGTPDPESDLLVYAETSSTSGLIQVYSTEMITEGDFRHLRYLNTPASIEDGFEFRVKIVSSTDVNEDYWVHQPYEAPVISTPTTLHDFLTGSPTQTDWQNLSDAANGLLDLQSSTNNAFLSVKREYDSNERYSAVKRNKYLYINYQVWWPERRRFQPEPDFGADFDTRCTIDGNVVFHRGTYLTKNEQLHPEVYCWNKLYAQVGDRCSLNGESGEITGIAAISGGWAFTVTWDVAAPTVVQYMERFKVWTSMTDLGNNVRPNEGRENVEQLVDLNALGISQNDAYSIQFDTEHDVPSPIDGQPGRVLIGYLGESVNVITGSPEPGWEKMAQWEHLDVVPGTGDKAINNIVENIRNLQEIKVIQSSATRYRADTYHFDLCFNHRHRWLAIIAEQKDDGTPESAEICFNTGSEFVTESLTYDEDSEGFEYIDLTQFPLLLEGGFYTLTNVEYAYEVDSIVSF